MCEFIYSVEISSTEETLHIKYWLFWKFLMNFLGMYVEGALKSSGNSTAKHYYQLFISFCRWWGCLTEWNPTSIMGTQPNIVQSLSTNKVKGKWYGLWKGLKMSLLLFAINGPLCRGSTSVYQENIVKSNRGIFEGTTPCLWPSSHRSSCLLSLQFSCFEILTSSMAIEVGLEDWGTEIQEGNFIA